MNRIVFIYNPICRIIPFITRWGMILILLFMMTGCQKKEPVPPPVINRYTDNITFFSKILNREVSFALYLPQDYTRNSDQRYATVYLLHGWGDHSSAWIKGGGVDQIIQSLEANGSISSMIYVMPNGLKTYYVNYWHGNFNYMDMLTQELLPYIDRHYRTKVDAAHRAVVGYSMGGYGAFILPYKHPELFCISVPMSMSWRTHAQYESEPSSVWDGQFGKIFGAEGSVGQVRLTPYYLAHDPFALFETEKPHPSLSVYMDCGDDEEQLSEAATLLHTLMRKQSIDHQMRVRNGAHTWDYWRSSLSAVLPYIDRKMRGISYPDITPATQFSTSHSDKVATEIFGSSTLKISLPKGYDQSDLKCHTLYFPYTPYSDFEKETDQIRLLFDSLQRDKNFIAVYWDASRSNNAPTWRSLADYMEEHYRVLPQSYHRLLLGNKECGKWIVEQTASSVDASHAVYLYDALLPDPFTGRSNVSYYLTLSDKGCYYETNTAAYLACRIHKWDHQYRILNGTDSAESLLYLLQESIPYIGVKLNKR